MKTVEKEPADLMALYDASFVPSFRSIFPLEKAKKG